MNDRELLEAIAKELNILVEDGCAHVWESDIESDYWICKKCKKIMGHDNDNAKYKFAGWYGGVYEDAGFFNSRKNAVRGINSDDKLHELFKKFDGEFIKITVEILKEK